MSEQALATCPFCGLAPTVDAYDRMISIRCDTCKYHRTFPGLLQRKESPVPVLQYKNANGEIETLAPEDVHEWYHADAHKDARAMWNTRATQ